MTGSSHRQAALLSTVALAAFLVACSPRIITHGYLPDPQDLATVKVGVHRQSDVYDLLGSPGSKSMFSPDKSRTWYYAMRRTKSETFFDEQVLDQKVYAIRFDESGVVSEVKTYELADGRLIEPVEEVTPTSGKRMTFFEQMVGNIGIFRNQAR